MQKSSITAGKFLTSYLLLVTMNLILATSATAQPSTYDLTELSISEYSVYGNAINASGQVAGYYSTGLPNSERAFVWDGASILDLGILMGNSASNATDINDDGMVTGYLDNGTAFLWDGNDIKEASGNSRGSSINNAGLATGTIHIEGVPHAFTWDGTTMMELGSLGGATSGSNGYFINNSGHVAGSSNTFVNTKPHAFIWDGNAMTDLGTLGGTESWPWDLNEAGQITGISKTVGDVASHAFFWDGTTMLDLGTLNENDGWSEGNAINETGHIAGTSGDIAFYWNGTTMVDLGTLGGAYSYGYAINNVGQVVGTSSPTDNLESHAFLWDGTTMYDLNDLINPQDPLKLYVVLNSANKISERGHILAKGRNIQTGLVQTYILTPNTIFSDGFE